tara:strand:+ start:315 stop:485 length:171 start_codon:yes stop_codon:yes gene_type:complete
MDTTRYTVKLYKDGEIIDYLNTNDEVLAHQTEFKLRKTFGRDNVWIADAVIEILVG